MKIRRPSFYEEFQCIASACTDTCCAGWLVEIDDNSLQRYRDMKDAFGEMLQKQIVQDEEGSFFRLLPGRRCAMLNEQNLCKMILEKGEDVLCDICREHPRFYQWFGDYTEVGIGLCCEEACRLLFSQTEPLTFTLEETEEEAAEWDPAADDEGNDSSAGEDGYKEKFGLKKVFTVEALAKTSAMADGDSVSTSEAGEDVVMESPAFKFASAAGEVPEMLSARRSEDGNDTWPEDAEEDPLIEPLLFAREAAFRILQERSRSLRERQKLLLDFSEFLDVPMEAEDAAGIVRETCRFLKFHGFDVPLPQDGFVRYLLEHTPDLPGRAEAGAESQYAESMESTVSADGRENDAAGSCDISLKSENCFMKLSAVMGSLHDGSMENAVPANNRGHHRDNGTARDCSDEENKGSGVVGDQHVWKEESRKTAGTGPGNAFLRRFQEKAVLEELLDFICSLEALKEEWPQKLQILKNSLPELLENRERFLRENPGQDRAYEQLLVYFVYRYFMDALTEVTVIPQIRFAVMAVEVIRLLDVETWLRTGAFTAWNRIENVKLFSKEIEYCPENMEALYEHVL